ncbi:Glyoxalase-like domain protein [Planctomycetes bacterium CA13]|uniref:Glyoxalase-like domain protein n=1 Tax=Novipirellula herctigrandis TaxID=2527986 RepID=A0A5C5YZW2_9BACT|nr:Glyoxalase-like domain protein [Planctomycetes bacterium CA13]
MNQHEKINYVEFPAKDMEATKQFFSVAFGWEFIDYGPDYAAVSDQGIEVGFYRSELVASTATGSVLVVFYSETLEETLAKVEKHGGVIVKPIISFPGGRRFQFVDPSGNELAVWSDREAPKA